MTAGLRSHEARLLLGMDGANSAELVAHVATHGPLPARTRAGADPALLDMIDASGLTGRGGAGFPAGRKMRTVSASDQTPVVVANGSEGEPASAKDTLLLTRAPHLVLDGIQVAARAVGADETHLVVHRAGLASALRARAAERTDDDVPLTIHELPRRYVSSEESAVVAWLNGHDAKPTFTPPRPFEQGVRRRPTLVNNVETLAHIALLARHGSDWFRSVGDALEPGTMLLTVRGPELPATVTEVATGTPIGDVLDRLGVTAAAAPAVLVGGYFGTWLPTEYAAQLPLTRQALRGAGSALGAGVLAALPAGLCALAETSRVVNYLAAQNAGQCGPCLNGLPAIATALQALAAAKVSDSSWMALERWLAVVPGRGACRHPDGVTRLVANTLTTFAADAAAHRGGRPCAGAAAPGWLPVPGPPQARWR
ncbi:MAG TPA: NADH-ubiquinone oxidoreductase-F iron-sulfur binding region domain-containing protein [Acidothermaceae bacterium]|jgi:NADH:ubiquinone oxidoreductase subunit F (NADH-binding)